MVGIIPVRVADRAGDISDRAQTRRRPGRGYGQDSGTFYYGSCGVFLTPGDVTIVVPDGTRDVDVAPKGTR